MIEIELFCKIVEAEIRRKHIKYLKKQKCLPYVKRFNKGIETALQVLLKEYARFDKRLRAESEKGKKF